MTTATGQVHRYTMLPNMRIGPRIVVCFAVMVLLIAATGATGYVGLRDSSRDLRGYVRHVELAATISAITTALLQLQLDIHDTGPGGTDGEELQRLVRQAQLVTGDDDQQSAVSGLGKDITLFLDKRAARERPVANAASAARPSDRAIEQAATRVLQDASSLQDELSRIEAIDRGEIVDAIEGTEAGMLAVLIVGVLVGAVLALLVGRSVTRPVVRLTAAMRALAAGNLDTDVPGADRRDEFGEMATALYAFRDSARLRLALEEERKAEQRLADTQRRALLDDMAGQFEQAVGAVVQGVAAAATQLDAGAESMHEVSTRVSDKAAHASTDVFRASSSLDAVAAASEELSSSIAEIARQTAESRSVVARATEVTSRANADVTRLVEASTRVEEIVDLISDIAQKTNLLALNATIEAARAGGVGKGFAVVASEVKALSQQTTAATARIDAYVTSMRQASDATAVDLRTIGDVMAEVALIADSVASVTEQQRMATSEIAHNIGEAARGAQSVSMTVSDTGEAAAAVHSAAAEVRTATSDLMRQSVFLQDEVHRFVSHIRDEATEPTGTTADMSLERAHG